MANLTSGIDHIGVTVPDIEEATTFFKKKLFTQKFPTIIRN